MPELSVRGKLDRTGAERIDHGSLLLGMVDGSGWLAGTPPGRSEADPCGHPVTFRAPDGTVRPGPDVGAGHCVGGTDTNPFDADYLAFIDLPSPELAMRAGWAIRVHDRHSGETWTAGPVAPNPPDQPIVYPSLDGGWLAWSELTAMPATSGADTAAYAVDLGTRSVVALGTGLSSAVVRWPYVFANQFGTDPRSGHVVRIDLRDLSRLEFAVTDARWLAASKDLLVASTKDGSVLVDFDGKVRATLPYHVDYPVAGDHLLVWSHFPDAATVQRQVLDTRCLALFDVGEAVQQGVGVSAAGSYISWRDWPADGEPITVATSRLFRMDVAAHPLCGATS